MTTNYNKKHYLQLLKERSMDDNSNRHKLSEYGCILQNQLDWEIREQYLELIDKFLEEKISIYAFFGQLQVKNDSIIEALDFLEKHRILLSPDKKAPKFGELIEELMEHLDDDLDFLEDELMKEMKNVIQEKCIKIKEYLSEE